LLVVCCVVSLAVFVVACCVACLLLLLLLASSLTARSQARARYASLVIPKYLNQKPRRAKQTKKKLASRASALG